MVREVISIINIWCDNTGRHPTEKAAAKRSVALAYDGKLVRLDLCDECRDEMAAVLDEYAGYGQVVDAPRSGRLDTAWTAVEDNNATDEDTAAVAPPPPHRSRRRSARLPRRPPVRAAPVPPRPPRPRPPRPRPLPHRNQPSDLRHGVPGKGEGSAPSRVDRLDPHPRPS
ncbi:hypothetical protein [Parafrankia sp. EUN1f]|uniref:hypothetical protein n=1 Tax=Parafrankia sp. EUN1f TaxID=102897 RepID=UPI0001C470B2|nr:hypothetical protein [Parafrankia sp. EUN1f]EFC80133.1 hypothetical protein FrEUN1fDRAFT_6737 [Parafrankia sp. EUN1f]